MPFLLLRCLDTVYTRTLYRIHSLSVIHANLMPGKTPLLRLIDDRYSNETRGWYSYVSGIIIVGKKEGKQKSPGRRRPQASPRGGTDKPLSLARTVSASSGKKVRKL